MSLTILDQSHKTPIRDKSKSLKGLLRSELVFNPIAWIRPQFLKDFTISAQHSSHLHL